MSPVVSSPFMAYSLVFLWAKGLCAYWLPDPRLPYGLLLQPMSTKNQQAVRLWCP